MRPACPGQSTHELGLARFVWFVKLKHSARNCKLWRSRIRNVLKNDISSCVKDGPTITSRPAVPKLPTCGRCQGPSTWPFAVNGTLVVLNQPNWSGLGTEKSPTRLGRHQPVSRSELQSR